ncbi:MAG: hypothetical protein HYZ53_14485, partial [Planctomycetes bacterium]|nr:hypothetical protein [Planctomycetota bacterium]
MLLPLTLTELLTRCAADAGESPPPSVTPELLAFEAIEDRIDSLFEADWSRLARVALAEHGGLMPATRWRPIVPENRRGTLPARMGRALEDARLGAIGELDAGRAGFDAGPESIVLFPEVAEAWLRELPLKVPAEARVVDRPPALGRLLAEMLLTLRKTRLYLERGTLSEWSVKQVCDGREQPDALRGPLRRMWPTVLQLCIQKQLCSLAGDGSLRPVPADASWLDLAPEERDRQAFLFFFSETAAPYGGDILGPLPATFVRAFRGLDPYRWYPRFAFTRLTLHAFLRERAAGGARPVPAPPPAERTEESFTGSELVEARLAAWVSEFLAALGLVGAALDRGGQALGIRLSPFARESLAALPAFPAPPPTPAPAPAHEAPPAIEVVATVAPAPRPAPPAGPPPLVLGRDDGPRPLPSLDGLFTPPLADCLASLSAADLLEVAGHFRKHRSLDARDRSTLIAGILEVVASRPPQLRLFWTLSEPELRTLVLFAQRGGKLPLAELQARPEAAGVELARLRRAGLLFPASGSGAGESLLLPADFLFYAELPRPRLGLVAGLGFYDAPALAILRDHLGVAHADDLPTTRARILHFLGLQVPDLLRSLEPRGRQILNAVVERGGRCPLFEFAAEHGLSSAWVFTARDLVGTARRGERPTPVQDLFRKGLLVPGSGSAGGGPEVVAVPRELEPVLSQEVRERWEAERRELLARLAVEAPEPDLRPRPGVPVRDFRRVFLAVDALGVATTQAGEPVKADLKRLHRVLGLEAGYLDSLLAFAATTGLAAASSGEYRILRAGWEFAAAPEDARPSLLAALLLRGGDAGPATAGAGPAPAAVAPATTPPPASGGAPFLARRSARTRKAL